MSGPVNSPASRETGGPDSTHGSAPNLSIVIPSWNGCELLLRHLPSVIGAAESYRQRTSASTEIIVVDDGSTDSTRTAIPARFPEVRLEVRKTNGGFSKACNTGFRVCRHPLVALLNNDVLVDPDYLDYQARHFENPEVFAVTSRVFEFEPPLFATGGKIGRFRRGFWSVYFNYDLADPGTTADFPLLSFYAVGGFAMYDRGKLQKLGGFNELLSPFHWEDVDLSYRAWKRGWSVHYEPRSIGYHRISATIDAHYEKPQVEELAIRNRILFHWINLHSRSFWVRHLLMLPVLLATRIWVGDVVFYRAFWGALRRLKPAMRQRRRERQAARSTDSAVARKLAAFYADAPIRIFRGRADVEASGPKPPPSGPPSVM